MWACTWISIYASQRGSHGYHRRSVKRVLWSFLPLKLFLRTKIQKEIEHLISESEFVFYIHRFFCRVPCTENLSSLFASILCPISANRILNQDSICWCVTIAIFFTLGIMLGVLAVIIYSHYLRWDDISPCSLSLPSRNSCTDLPTMDLFDPNSPIFGDCYACTR